MGWAVRRRLTKQAGLGVLALVLPRFQGIGTSKHIGGMIVIFGFLLFFVGYGVPTELAGGRRGRVFERVTLLLSNEQIQLGVGGGLGSSVTHGFEDRTRYSINRHRQSTEKQILLDGAALLLANRFIQAGTSLTLEEITTIQSGGFV